MREEENWNRRNVLSKASFWVYTYTLTDHVLGAAIRNALQIYDVGERIQGYNNKSHNHILIMDSARPRTRWEDSLWDVTG
jgi:hypothetical protein